ncbi:hypothetical protein CKO28_00780 [Rhodovibrio sodomensis]|uniref:Uncharacterized protein n=1 Tax=Rhodovibrio sodomensis TaxID=1088 RepID=A0ABS1D9K7_9PROT|nr:hypothetical protein [Rhodovibrio sodomensis]MBK1666576.1 hypothetical protein [Rhodovibrio sodomensis]
MFNDPEYETEQERDHRPHDQQDQSILMMFLVIFVILAIWTYFMAALAPFSYWTWPFQAVLEWLFGDVRPEGDQTVALFTKLLFGVLAMFVVPVIITFGTFYLLNLWTQFTMSLKLMLGSVGGVLFWLEPVLFGFANFYLNANWITDGRKLLAEAFGDEIGLYVLMSASTVGGILYLRSMLRTRAYPLLGEKAAIARPRLPAIGRRGGDSDADRFIE